MPQREQEGRVFLNGLQFASTIQRRLLQVLFVKVFLDLYPSTHYLEVFPIDDSTFDKTPIFVLLLS